MTLVCDFAFGLASVLCNQGVTSADPQVPARDSNFTLMTVEEKQMHLSALLKGGSKTRMKTVYAPYSKEHSRFIFSAVWLKKPLQ